MVRVPSATESMPVSKRIFASMQLALRLTRTPTRQEALMLCSLPQQRPLLCLGSLKQSRSVLPLLSGIVLACVGPQDVGEPLAIVSLLAALFLDL